jgi:hypothetical protein
MATQLLKTVKPSGGDYTSLEACMNANEQNLVTADKYFDVKIDGTWSSADTTACTIHNYTTDATRYINIYTTSAARRVATDPLRYGGTSTAYRLAPSVTYGYALNLLSPYTYITGIQLTNTGGDHSGLIYNTTSFTYLIKCILTGGTTGRGLIEYNDWIPAANASCFLINNLIYNSTTYGIESGRGGGGGHKFFYFYDNTIYNSGNIDIQFSDIGGGVVENTIVNGGTITVSGATLTTNLTGTTGVTFVSVTGGSEDFHLASTDTVAIDHGTDASANGNYNFTDDIDGVTRTGIWDIGADEYVAAGGAYKGQLMMVY